MGQAAVRRSSSRKRRSVRESSVETTKQTKFSWTNEILGLLLIFACVGSLIAFLGHQIAVSARNTGWVGWFGAFSELLGPMGKVIGSLLVGGLGWSAIGPIWLCGVVGLAVWRWGDDSVLDVGHIFSRAVGLIIGLFALAAACAAIGGRTGGGDLGMVVAGPLSAYFSALGAFLGALLFGVIGASLFLHRSPNRVVVMACVGVGGILRNLGLEWPRAVIGGFRGGLEWLLQSRGGEERVLAKPRLRKNEIKDQEEGVEDEAAEEEDEESDERYTHVVVNRRTSSLAKQKGGKLREETTQPSPVWPNYELPDLKLLSKGEKAVSTEDDSELRHLAKLIEAKLKDFSIFGRVTEIHPGPVITLFEFEPAAGVKVARITSFQDDLAMGLKAKSVRIIAPIPGRGTVGVEVPNRQRDVVRLRDVLEADSFVQSKSVLTMALGKDTYGEPVSIDLASMPHLLMAGATGTGKSVSINAILMSLLYRSSPAEVGLILIDPKILELSVYDRIPHLRVPVVTVPRQAKAVLDWAVREMDRRYRMMQKYGVRNIDAYNAVVSGADQSVVKKKAQQPEKTEAPVEVIELDEQQVVAEGTQPKPSMSTSAKDFAEGWEFAEQLEPLAKIVIIIDELADLMMQVGKDIEDLIARLAQKARAAGIHLIVATQRPSVDVITGLIKANFPARLSFQVSSRIDSRTILDCMGAEKLLGKGDMLFMDPTVGQLRRIHGAFVADQEVKKVIDAVRAKGEPQYDDHIMRMCERAMEEETTPGPGGEEAEYDPIYDQCVQFVLDKRVASTSMLQRAFRLGYNRAARIIEKMEREGIVGPMDGAKPRQVLVPDADGEG